MKLSDTLRCDKNTPIKELPYLSFTTTRKGFEKVDCRLCGCSGDWDHLKGKKHRNKEAEVMHGMKTEKELFKKFYAETYLSIKYIPWREKMRKELEIFDERGVWNGCIFYSGVSVKNTPESVIRATFSSLLFRDAMALLELSIIKCFMKETKKRKVVATKDESNFTTFETIRTTRAHQILQLVKPFLMPMYISSDGIRWRF